MPEPTPPNGRHRSPEPESGKPESTRDPYWLDRRQNRRRTHWGRGPSREEAQIEALLRDWYGPALADAEISARRRPPARVGEFLDEVIERLGVAGDIHLHRLQQEWARIVGPAVAAQTMPVRIDRKRVLWVEVGNPSWLYNLETFQKSHVLESVRSRSGIDLTGIRFVPAGRRRPFRRR